jgi:hypothetical protein
MLARPVWSLRLWTISEARNATLKALPCDGHRIAGELAHRLRYVGPWIPSGSASNGMLPKELKSRRRLLNQSTHLSERHGSRRCMTSALYADIAWRAQIQPRGWRSFNVALWYASVARWTLVSALACSAVLDDTSQAIPGGIRPAPSEVISGPAFFLLYVV